MSNVQGPKSILDSILKKGVDQAEIYFSSTRTLKIDVLDRKVESVDEIRDAGYGIRVIRDKKLGFAFTSDPDPAALEETMERAVDNAKSSAPDEFNLLPNYLTTTRPSSSRSHPPKGLDLFDPKISRTPVKDKIELALKIEEAAYRTDKRVKRTEKVSYSDSESEVWIVNSNGIEAKHKSNFCGGHADMIAAQDSEMEAGLGIDFVKKLADLDPQKIGKEAAERASALLGARAIPSRKLPLLFDPFVGTQLLEVLASALSSDATQKGKSLFADKLGKEIGSEIFSLIDNGRLPGGLGTEPCDGEGVPTQETRLVENGILRNFLYNTYTAAKGGTRSTGNAVRSSFSGLPGIGPTNLFIPAGPQSAPELIRSVRQGLYIQRVMGVHTANPISGDFSFGAAGLMIENGEKTYPVRGITIAGNLIEMLKAIEAVCSDLRFIVNIGSPTLLITGITVSGG